MYHFTALVTCLAIAVYFYSSILVSQARGKFGVKVPATSGNADFERVFRAQMNTLEWLPLPAVAVAICDLYWRRDRSFAGTGLGDRPHSLHLRLCAGDRKTRTRLLCAG